MSGETALDRAMRESGGDAAAGRAVDALLSSQLFLLLDAAHLHEDAHANPGRLRPKTLPLEAGETALAFDTEERLAAFAGGEAAYAEVSGRLLAGMLAGEGVHLAVNPGVAPSELFHEAAALRWMAEVSATRTEAQDAAPGAVGPPSAASEALAAALDAKLAALAAGLAEAWLVQADGPRLILALRERGTWGEDEAAERHRAALAKALGETARLAAPEGPPLEAAFPAPAEAAAWAAIRRVGLGFDLPAPAAPSGPQARPAPGSDPARPPKLR